MEYRFFFFAGGEYTEDENNAFTTNFIRFLSEIFGDRFSIIQDIYHSKPLINVIWALNRAQEPVRYPYKNKIIASSVKQIMSDPHIAGAQLTLLSSSYGSVVAAQTACCLAERLMAEKFLNYPFNITLGASMVSKKSGLFKKLLYYQEKGMIGTIIYDELQDEGDNSNGLGGTTKLQAYTNGLGICFPFMTFKFRGPSFLSTHPVTGHLHRVRAQSVQKAKDFLQVILVDYPLGGKEAKVKAEEILKG